MSTSCKEATSFTVNRLWAGRGQPISVWSHGGSEKHRATEGLDLGDHRWCASLWSWCRSYMSKNDWPQQKMRPKNVSNQVTYFTVSVRKTLLQRWKMQDFDSARASCVGNRKILLQSVIAMAVIAVFLQVLSSHFGIFWEDFSLLKTVKHFLGDLSHHWNLPYLG